MTVGREFVGQVQGGRLPREIERHIDDAIRRAEGKWVTVKLAVRKKRRSLNQNAYMWGVVIPRVLDMFRDCGNDVDADQVHDYLRAHVGKLTESVVDRQGNRKAVLRSTTTLSTTEFESYMTQVRAWAAENGCDIPEPNEGLLTTRGE